MNDSELDDALWLALSSRVDSIEALQALPPGVRMYFATRMVEWEAGSGGFDAALDNAGEYIDEALAGYRLLGDLPSVDLWERVLDAADDADLLDELSDEVEGPPWNGVPWGDTPRIAYVRAHRDEFRI